VTIEVEFTGERAKRTNLKPAQAEVFVMKIDVIVLDQIGVINEPRFVLVARVLGCLERTDLFHVGEYAVGVIERQRILGDVVFLDVSQLVTIFTGEGGAAFLLAPFTAFLLALSLLITSRF